MISVSTDRDGGLAVVAVSGEVDLATGPVMADAFGRALALDGVEAVRVDLSALQFLDSSGIAVLLRARRNADERGITFRVVGARGVPLQVLELTGVWEHLHGDPTPDQPGSR
jgi:anti-anti-sigma factor